MNSLQFNTMDVKVPSKFSEMSLWQLKRVVPLLLAKHLDELRNIGASEMKKKKKSKRNGAVIHLISSEFFAVRLQLLFILLNLRFKFRLQFFLWRKMTPDLYFGILTHQDNVVDWLFKHELTEQLVPSVRVLGKKYLGPRANFHSMSYLEYTMAHARYVAWLNDRSRENLQRFFAVLYRPERNDVLKTDRRYSRDAREVFDPIKTDEKANVFKYLDERVMLIAVLWFKCCTAKKMALYPHVYTGETAEKPLTPKQVIIKLAGSSDDDAVLGICDAPYDNVMEDLDMKNAEAKEAQSPNKGMKAL